MVSDGGPPPAVVAGNALPDVLPITPAEIARYEGTYALQAGGRTLDVRVFGADGKLMAQPAGQNATELLRTSEHGFLAAADRGIRLVFALVDGRAESVELHQGGGVYVRQRKP